MNDDDLHLRRQTYAQVTQLGRPPMAAEVAAASGRSLDEVRAGWRRLHAEPALVRDKMTGEIIMANPFSAAPTAYRVQASGRWWYGNCAWDAFGVCAALHADGQIEASCPDCGHELCVAVHGERPNNDTLLFHYLVPAVRWWDDIVFT